MTPTERIQIDLVDFPKDEDQGYKWLLHIQDHFSKYCCQYPLCSKHAHEVAPRLGLFYEHIDDPIVKQSGNGGEFKEVVEESMRSRGPVISHGRPCHPQSQGSVERADRGFKMRIARIKHRSSCGWVDAAREAVQMYDRTYQRDLKACPCEIFFGRKPFRLQCLLPGETVETPEVDSVDPKMTLKPHS